MQRDELPTGLQRAVDFHGHLCPGLAIGWRAAEAAAQALGIGPAADEELVAEVENDSCSADAFQALLSTTFGKGNLVFRDHGKQVFTVTDRNQGRAVRVSFVGEGLKTQKPDGSTDREAFLLALIDAPQEQVVAVGEVSPRPPAEAVIEPSTACARCGEPTQRSKMQKGPHGRLLCRPCAREAAA